MKIFNCKYWNLTVFNDNYDLIFRSVESDSTDRCSGSSSSSGSRTVFVCTSRGAARPAPASIPKSTGCTGKLPCTCSTRCRGGSAEKVIETYNLIFKP